MSLLLLYGPAGVAPPPVQQQSGNVWEVYLCDRFGFPISNISRVCFGKQLTQTLNQPASFTFWAPSNDGRVASLHSDGKPYLMEGRAIRVYRNGVLVFTGHLWQVEDTGAGEAVKTAVTCFDPLQWLSRRIARQMEWQVGWSTGTSTINLFISRSDATTAWDQIYAFTLNPLGITASFGSADIVRGLLNATNDYDGFTGLDDYYLSSYYRPDHSTPAASTNQSAPTTPLALPVFSNSRISDVIATLVGQNGSLDLEVVPTDVDYYSSPSYPSETTGATFQQAYLVGSSSDYTSIHGTLKTKPWKTLALLKYYAPTKGAAQPNVMFGYGAYPHNIEQISYLTDLTELSNFSTMMGGALVKRSLNSSSVQTYGVGMDVQSLADITDPALLQALAVEEATLGGNAKRTLQLTPMGGSRTPLPFDNFVLGDTVSVQAGSKLRGGFTGTQRVYGFTLDISDDHTTETLTNLITSPQTAF